jgi:hypothetical protein
MSASCKVTVWGPISTAGFCHTTLSLAATDKVTAPFPLPELPALTEMDGLSETALQGQCTGAVTAICTVPPEEGTLVLPLKEYVQLAGACAIVKDLPATEMLPERGDFVWLAASDAETMPEPAPELPLWIVIQLAEVLAVHAHPLGAVTVAYVVSVPYAVTEAGLSA